MPRRLSPGNSISMTLSRPPALAGAKRWRTRTSVMLGCSLLVSHRHPWHFSCTRPAHPATLPEANRMQDVIVIGGGAVGMATALSLSEIHNQRVLVLEAESRLATHQT